MEDNHGTRDNGRKWLIRAEYILFERARFLSFARSTSQDGGLFKRRWLVKSHVDPDDLYFNIQMFLVDYNNFMI